MANLVDNLRRAGAHRTDPDGVQGLLRAAGLLVGVFILGTVGYWSSAPAEYDLLDCAYMTVITLTTVGYTEVIPVESDPFLQGFTIGLIVVGMGIMLYFVSSVAAFIIEGGLRTLVSQRRMTKKISHLNDHLILCGIGQTGAYVLREILQSNYPCLVIEQSRERLEQQRREMDHDFLYLAGDATQDQVLQQAGIGRAAGLIASLGNDRDNLFVTITARSLNADMRIVARSEHPDAEQKFKMAGATSVIYTNVLGGMRMAAEAIRPEVTTFLDLTMHDHEHYRRVEELPVADTSPLIGKTIRQTRIRHHTDALVIAVYRHEHDEYIFNPGPDYALTAGSKLIVLTLVDDIETLEALIRGDL